MHPLQCRPAGRHCYGCIVPQAVTQSSAPEEGRDHRPKHVELIGIINKPLLLQLVGVYIIYDRVCNAEGFGLLLAKVCDPIAALTLCKQNHPLKLSAHISRTAVLCLIRDVVLKRAKMDLETILVSHSCEQVESEYGNDKEELWFVDGISSGAGHK